MVEIEWLGTAGFRITYTSGSFLIDPYVMRNERATPPQPLGPADLRSDGPIFLSHGHFDHASDVPEIMSGTGAVAHGSATALASILRAGAPLTQLRAMHDGETLGSRDFTAQAFASRHIHFDARLVLSTLRRLRWDELTAMNLALRYPAGACMSWRFTCDDLAIHHFGSAGSTEAELRRLGAQRTDVLLIALQGHSRIVDIALRHVEVLRPRIVIPHHHDNFYPPISRTQDISPFVDGVRKRWPKVEVLTPAINVRLQLR